MLHAREATLRQHDDAGQPLLLPGPGESRRHVECRADGSAGAAIGCADRSLRGVGTGIARSGAACNVLLAAFTSIRTIRWL